MLSDVSGLHYPSPRISILVHQVLHAAQQPENFGPVGTPTGPLGYAGPNIIARNLTPDNTGRPEGGPHACGI
jgi:hypothetical protein